MKKWVFISGASSGIGKATALKLHQQGCGVILNGRRKERLEELKNQLGENARTACFDVTQPEAVEKWRGANGDLVRGVSVLVNNAGLALGKEPVQSARLEDWFQMIDTNLKALLHLTKVFIPSLLEHRGHLVNVGSVAGRWSYPGGSVYNATKFGVRALSEAFRMDLLGTGVRVTNVEPGMVETEFSKVRLGDEEEARKVYQGMTPLQAEDIAETIAWCLDRPAHVNIQELVVFPTDQGSVRDIARKN